MNAEAKMIDKRANAARKVEMREDGGADHQWEGATHAVCF